MDVVLYKLYDPSGIKHLTSTMNAGVPNVVRDLMSKYDVEEETIFVKETPKNIEEYEVETNIKTEFEEVNNEIILTLSIPKYTNYYFYPIVKIFKY